MVEVVVVEEDFGFDAGFLEGGAEVMRDEVVLLGFEHEHGGRVLFVERLVLNGERVDDDAFGLHSLDVFDPVFRVGGEVLREQHAALCFAVGLHPEGCRPGRSEDFDLWIDGEDFFNDGDDVGLVGREREVRSCRVRLTFGKIVVGVDVVVMSDEPTVRRR